MRQVITIFSLSLLLVATAAAQDEGARDYPDPLDVACPECKAQRRLGCKGEGDEVLEKAHPKRVAEAKKQHVALFVWEVVPSEGLVLVRGKSKLPDGTRLSGAIRVGESPVAFKKAFVMKGEFRFAFPRRELGVGTYQAMVLFEQRGQIRELAGKLRAYPPAYSRRLTFRLGSALDAAKASLAEAELLQRSLQTLQEHLATAKPLFEQHRKLIQAKTYKAPDARNAWDKWRALTTTKLRELIRYADANKAYHVPGHVTEAVNLIDRTDRYAKALHRAELQAAGIKGVPREYFEAGMLSSPGQLYDHIGRNLPALLKALEKRVAADKARVEKGGQ